MPDKKDEQRTIVRFHQVTGEHGGPYIELDFGPVITAILGIGQDITSKLTEISEKLDAITYIMRNGDGITVGQKAVEAAGTPVQLPSMVVPDGKSAVIWALDTNVGNTYYGGSQSEAAGHKFPVPKNQARTVKCTNLDQIWIDADNNNDAVSYGTEKPPKET